MRTLGRAGFTVALPALGVAVGFAPAGVGFGGFGGAGCAGFAGSIGIARSSSIASENALSNAASSSRVGAIALAAEKLGAPRAGVTGARAPIDDAAADGVCAGLRTGRRSASGLTTGHGPAVGASNPHSSSTDGGGVATVTATGFDVGFVTGRPLTGVRRTSLACAVGGEATPRAGVIVSCSFAAISALSADFWVIDAPNSSTASRVSSATTGGMGSRGTTWRAGLSCAGVGVSTAAIGGALSLLPNGPKYTWGSVVVAIRVSLLAMIAWTGCGDASSSTAPDPEPAKVIPAPKIEEALASIVATCARCDAGVEVRRKGKPYWEAIAMGGTFRDGDWIRTSASGARIRFVSGGHLDLDEKTTLFVEADTAKRAANGDVAGVHVAMQTGGASGVLDGTKDAPIAIRTADGEVRIAGTGASSEFRLEPTKDGAVEVAVSKGELLVRSGTTEKKLDAKPPAPEPVKPKVLIPPRPKRDGIAFPSSVAPRIDAHFQCLLLLDIPLQWQPVAGATKYKVVVARDLSFRSIVSAKEITQTRFTFTPPGPGTYVWRVAARDARGYGEFGFARRVFCDKK